MEIVPLIGKDDAKDIMTLAEKYYQELQALGFDVLVDDRDESVGRKLNDADLIGIPLRIIIGKRNPADKKVEIKKRDNPDSDCLS